MGRYDRIATLPPPARDDVFSGWLALRDLEGAERDVELGRRARLRFLALRVALRALRQPRPPSNASLERQVEAVREELGQLPTRDPERSLLAELLTDAARRDALQVVSRLLELGALALEAGQRYAAEEFFRASAELAEGRQLLPQQVAALIQLGRLLLERGQTREAARCFLYGADLAADAEDRLRWAQSLECLATLHRRTGELDAARAVLEEVLEAGRETRDAAVIGVASAARCGVELDGDAPEAAVEHGWAAVQAIDDDAAREPVLLDLGRAFRRLRLRSAADAAYGIVAARAASAARRLSALTGLALVAAEFGDAEAFHDSRAVALELAGAAPPRVRAPAHLELARGSLLLSDADAAREHLRTAVADASVAGNEAALSGAEDLLAQLERAVDAVAAAPAASPTREATRRIAAEVESLGRALVHT